MTGSEMNEEERDEASAEEDTVSGATSAPEEGEVVRASESGSGEEDASAAHEVVANGGGFAEETEAGEEEELPPLVSVLEAALFASAEPLPLNRLTRVLGAWSRKQVVAALAELGERQERETSGLRVVETAGGYQLRSSAEYAPWVRKFFVEKPPRLSRAVLETLAVVAYRQPATRGEVEAVRGVNCDAVLGTLTARGLIEVNGRRPSPGRPVEYGTTQGFLELFSLKNLDELPPLPEPAALAKLIDQAEEALEAEANGEAEEALEAEANGEAGEALEAEANGEAEEALEAEANGEAEEALEAEANGEAEEALEAEANGEAGGDEAGPLGGEAAKEVVVLSEEQIAPGSADEDRQAEGSDGVGEEVEASRGARDVRMAENAPEAGDEDRSRSSSTPALGPPAPLSGQEAGEEREHTVTPESSRQGPTVFRAAAGGSGVGVSEGRNTGNASNDRAVAEDLEPGGNRVSARGGDSDLGGAGSGQR
jgi:segregation and condensation protein B